MLWNQCTLVEKSRYALKQLILLEARWACTVNSIDLVRINISIPVNNIPTYCNVVSAMKFPNCFMEDDMY